MRNRWLGVVGLVAVAAACSSSSSSDVADAGGTEAGGGDDASSAVDGSSASVHVVVGTAGGQLTSADGALTVSIPSGALSGDTTITIDPIGAPAAGAIGQSYEIGPTGTVFAVPITLAFKYSSGDLQGSDPQSLEVATVVSGAWVGLSDEAVDTGASVASAETSHLSPYGLHLHPKGNDGGGDSASSDGATNDSAASDSAGTDSASSDSAVGDASPSDAGSDVIDAGCTHQASQVYVCANHPVQGLCPGNTYFTNCVDQSQGMTWDCCPGG